MINQSHNHATVIIPGPGLNDAEVLTRVAPVFRMPYTYSDMTGAQLSIVTRPPGEYRQLLGGCEEGPTEWEELLFDVWAPEGTTVVFRVRTGDDPAAFGEADWMNVATVPSDASPVSLRDALDSALVPHGAFLELEIRLAAEPSEAGTDPTPVVHSVGVSYRCEPEIPEVM
jgi:hypothetical protein